MKLKEVQTDLLLTRIYDSRDAMGTAAAADAVRAIQDLLKGKPVINVLFAAAPSQNEFLSALKVSGIDWSRIRAFHMDEYVGLGKENPQRFGNYLKKQLFEAAPFHSVYYLFEEGMSAEEMCARYDSLLKKYPLDLICMGIGENGHIAFNDPHVALFDDPEWVKIVSLDEVCRAQQVHDGCFPSLDEVPQQAVTVTIPVITGASRIFCVVPGKSKAEAINKTLNGDITTGCPATILRRHPRAILYCDRESASGIL